MAVTERNLTSDGSTSYTFPFEYLKTTDIKISVNGTDTTEFTVPTATSVQFNTGHVPASGAAIRIYRDTNVDNLEATFYAGSAIKSQDLNDNFSQIVFVTQEAKRDVDSAWQTGDETIISTETWASNNTRVATTGAIDGRIDVKIDTALTTDVSGGDGVTIVDNSPGSGQIRVDLDADIATLKDMQSGAATALAALTSTELAILDGATVSTAELNLLDGATVTTTELNLLDGVTSTTTELNLLDGVTSSTAELNILDGVTATTAELNILDGVTATAAELNILDGVTSSTAEINLLDGVTATTAELNKTDGLTSTPTELNILDGATVNTSEINKLDGVTASTTELNIVSGKTFKTSSGTLDTTSDTEIPSSKVIAAHVASSQTAIGGFITIADEVSFPNTQPANGVVVSINNAAGVVVNGSGVSTTGRRLDSTVVTINGFPSSLNSETLAAGVGLVVTSTSTANTYTYHKLLAAETDVKQLSDDINDFNARYRVASSAPSSSNDDGDLWFDTSGNKMKVYNATGSSWDDVASVGQFFINTLSSSSGTGGGSATFNGSAYRFTLSNPATGGAQQLIVSINGVIQKPNTGTSQPSEGFAIDGNDIIFSAAPASGSDFFIITQGTSVSIGTPSANSVNSSHIIDGSIVNADISSSAAIAKTKLASLDVVNADVNASAAIAGSKLADDSIAEVKLDISNTPTDGYFLKYKDSTDKLTWSAVDLSAYLPLSGGNLTGNVSTSGGINSSANITTTAAVTGSTVVDGLGNMRRLSGNTQASTYTLVAADSGKYIYAGNTVTIPGSVFTSGDMITIVNNTAGDITLTASSVTLYHSKDGATGSRTLGTRGIATVLYHSASIAYITGSGLS